MVDDVLRYWPVIAFILTIIIVPALGAWIRSGLVTRAEYVDQMAEEQKARVEAQTELDRRVTAALAGVDRRLIQVETDIKHLPTAEDVAELKDRLSDVGAQGTQTARTVDAISRSVTRIEDHLMKGV